MFSSQKSRKIDTSFLKYLSEEDVTNPQVTMEQVNKSYPHTKKSTLEALKMFYVLNYNWLDEEQKEQLTNKIDLLQRREEELFKKSFDIIECQNQHA
jgi:hypothetical protein